MKLSPIHAQCESYSKASKKTKIDVVPNIALSNLGSITVPSFRLQMDWYPFSEEEKAMLLRSWKCIESQKQAIGCDIYEMIFNQVSLVFRGRWNVALIV